MKRVLIIGCPGTGKSTLARALATVTNLPLYHLDLIWHKSDRSTITRAELCERLSSMRYEIEDIGFFDGSKRSKRCCFIGKASMHLWLF